MIFRQNSSEPKPWGGSNRRAGRCLPLTFAYECKYRLDNPT